MKSTKSINLRTKPLSGVGNRDFHQYIISDLIYGIRKKLTKERMSKMYSVLSEISLSSLGYDLKNNIFKHDYNIDLVVIEEPEQSIVFIAEIAHRNSDLKKNRSKVEECVKKIDSVTEAFLIKFDNEGKTFFELCTFEKNRCKWIDVTSNSPFLNLVLKKCLTSLKTLK